MVARQCTCADSGVRYSLSLLWRAEYASYDDALSETKKVECTGTLIYDVRLSI